MGTKPFIPVGHPLLCGNERAYVNECLDTVWISSHGRFIPAFEEAFARICGVEHAIACNNGTSALHLALLASGVGPDNEVIVPTLTYIATANAVRYCGATPVLVDSEPRTFNLDPDRIASLITARTRAIVVVHLYGHPADMDPVLELASRHGITVIEDAAEAHGALYRDRAVGGIGRIAAFSFFGNKIVTTGEGGMVTTNDASLARKVVQLRGQGVDPEKRYWFPVIGYNYRMTNIAAAIGLAQIEQFELHLERRRSIASWYARELSGLDTFLKLPLEEEWARHSFWSYVILLSESVELPRDEFMRRLALEGVETRPVFYPLHTMPPYQEPAGRYPTAEALSRNGISLPAHGMLSEEDVVYISGCVRALCRP